MFLRVRRFGVENADRFPQTTAGGQFFADLDRIIVDFTANTSRQVDGDQRSAFAGKARTRTALRADINAVAYTAKSLERDIPDLRGKFRISGGLSDPDLLALARAFAEYAAPWRDRFIAHALPENFLEDLLADIANFEAAVERKSAATGNRSAAVRTLDELAGRGAGIVTRLDAIVRNTFRGNEGKLAEWKRARTLDKITGRGAVTEAKTQKAQAAQAAAA